jgi:hypothetical protein
LARHGSRQARAPQVTMLIRRAVRDSIARLGLDGDGPGRPA